MGKKYRALYTSLMILWDLFSVWISIVLGFRLRAGFAGGIQPEYERNFLFYTIVIFLIVLISNLIFSSYNSVWRHASTVEVVKQICSVLSVFIILTLIILFTAYNGIWSTPIPPEVTVIVCVLILIFQLAGRMSIRAVFYFRTRYAQLRRKDELTRVLIYGAGVAGVQLHKRMLENANENYMPVAFLDDDPKLIGCKVNGMPVMGGFDELERVIQGERIDEVIVAIPSADRDFLKKLLVQCQTLGCPLRRFGSIEDISLEDFSQVQIKSINLDELLRRDSVRLNMDAVKRFVENKTVLVTGGVGSIGSEICRQVLGFGAKELIVFDINENGLYEIDNELKKRYPQERYVLCLGSIRDTERLDELFAAYHPDLVFHAAAHKHVPMMELNPKEAIKNNLFGTINVGRAAIRYGAAKFILISTDKAVNPTSIMGASKRMAELSIGFLNREQKTEFAAVRFGNVLGSNGSVVPFFKKQIAEGGPVTVTHPEMRRYFMTIPEAVQLVLEAGSMARGGEIFVLDMGEPVLITDLASDMIRLSGLTPNKDIDIVYTGLRPGEKLFEEISLKSEDVTKTANNKIFILKAETAPPAETREQILRLNDLLNQPDTDIFAEVKKLVPNFTHEPAKRG